MGFRQHSLRGESVLYADATEPYTDERVISTKNPIPVALKKRSIDNLSSPDQSSQDKLSCGTVGNMSMRSRSRYGVAAGRGSRSLYASGLSSRYILRWVENSGFVALNSTAKDQEGPPWLASRTELPLYHLFAHRSSQCPRRSSPSSTNLTVISTCVEIYG